MPRFSLPLHFCLILFLFLPDEAGATEVDGCPPQCSCNLKRSYYSRQGPFDQVDVLCNVYAADRGANLDTEPRLDQLQSDNRSVLLTIEQMGFARLSYTSIANQRIVSLKLLNNPKLTTIDAAVFRHIQPSLRHLSIMNHDALVSLPLTAIAECSQLRELSVQLKVPLRKPPDFYVTKLQHLKSLTLQGPQFFDIIEDVYRLRSLQTLSLIDLGIGNPELRGMRLFELANLRTLNLATNYISTLPPYFRKLASLEVLSLEKNHLRVTNKGRPGTHFLPAFLQTLNLRGNYITSLPCELFNRKNPLRYLKLDEAVLCLLCKKDAALAQRLRDSCGMDQSWFFLDPQTPAPPAPVQPPPPPQPLYPQPQPIQPRPRQPLPPQPQPAPIIPRPVQVPLAVVPTRARVLVAKRTAAPSPRPSAPSRPSAASHPPAPLRPSAATRPRPSAATRPRPSAAARTRPAGPSRPRPSAAARTRPSAGRPSAPSWPSVAAPAVTQPMTAGSYPGPTVSASHTLQSAPKIARAWVPRVAPVIRRPSGLKKSPPRPTFPNLAPLNTTAVPPVTTDYDYDNALSSLESQFTISQKRNQLNSQHHSAPAPTPTHSLPAPVVVGTKREVHRNSQESTREDLTQPVIAGATSRGWSPEPRPTFPTFPTLPTSLLPAPIIAASKRPPTAPLTLSQPLDLSTLPVFELKSGPTEAAVIAAPHITGTAAGYTDAAAGVAENKKRTRDRSILPTDYTVPSQPRLLPKGLDNRPRLATARTRAPAWTTPSPVYTTRSPRRRPSTTTRRPSTPAPTTITTTTSSPPTTSTTSTTTSTTTISIPPTLLYQPDPTTTTARTVPTTEVTTSPSAPAATTFAPQPETSDPAEYDETVMYVDPQIWTEESVTAETTDTTEEEKKKPELVVTVKVVMPSARKAAPPLPEQDTLTALPDQYYYEYLDTLG